MTDRAGRTALVTGASRGLGRAIAERLAADGALVAVRSPGSPSPRVVYAMTKGALNVLGRVGEPVDIADAVAFFAAPDSRWVTGQVLDVNGGLYLGPKAALHH